MVLEFYIECVKAYTYSVYCTLMYVPKYWPKTINPLCMQNKFMQIKERDVTRCRTNFLLGIIIFFCFRFCNPCSISIRLELVFMRKRFNKNFYELKKCILNKVSSVKNSKKT